MESLDELLPFGAKAIAVVPATEEGVEAEIRKEQCEAIGKAIIQLPDEFRMPLVLKDIAGLSVADIARILDIKEGTIKTRVHRARLRLRKSLEEGLPKAELPPPAYSRQVCLDLLRAKQESLDRGVEMPDGDAVICERCQAVFETLDLTKEVCRTMGDIELPPRLRKLLVETMQAQPDSG